MTNSPQTPDERILAVADLIKISAEAEALIKNAQLTIDLEALKLWYFKRYVTIGSGFVVEFIAQQNRQKKKQLERDARFIETKAQQNQTESENN